MQDKTETGPNGFDLLMDKVCVGMGFCGSIKYNEPLHVTMFIPLEGPVTADQFVEWIFLADNMNPNSEPERWQPHKNSIRAEFIKCMGGEVVDASQLRWSNCMEDDPMTADVKYRRQLP